VAQVKANVIQALPEAQRPQVAAFVRDDPLRPGDSVDSYAPEGFAGGPIAISHPSWLFMLDLQPYKKFVHPVQYVIVDGVTGEITIRDAQWWPRVNGQDEFARQEERSAPDSQARIWPEGGASPAPLSAAAARVTARAPEIPSLPFLQLADHVHCPPGTLAKKVALLIAGSTEPSPLADVSNMRGLLTAAGFTVSTPSVWSVSGASQEITRLSQQLNPCDKFLFYFSGHGSSVGIDLSGDRWNFSGSLGSPGNPGIKSLVDTLKDLPAKHIEILIDACDSGAVLPPVTNTWPGSSSDVSVVGGTAADDRTSSDMVNDEFINYGLDWWGIRDFGSTWTKALADCLKKLTQDNNGDGFPDADANQDGQISPGEWENGERSCLQRARQAASDQNPQIIDNQVGLSR